jgi:hypothetical protein
LSSIKVFFLPRRFLEHFHSLLFLRSKRGDADAPGLPSGISPRPRCGSDPQKKDLLPGSGLVVSCLVSWFGEFFVASRCPKSSSQSGCSGAFWIQCRAFWIQCPCTGVVPRRVAILTLDWEPCRSGERCCCCQTVGALAAPVPACMGATSALTSKPAALAPPPDCLAAFVVVVVVAMLRIVPSAWCRWWTS